MKYNYECEEHGRFTVEAPMRTGPPVEVFCCGKRARRIYDSQSAPIYNAQGFHRTDYDKFGDKRELIAGVYKKSTGENPPPDDTAAKARGGKID